VNDEKKLPDEFPAMTPAEIEKIEDAAIRSAANMGLRALTPEELEAKVQEEMASGMVLEITQTDTITAKIAQLPVTALSIDFMVEVLEPIHLIPQIIQIGLTQKELSGDPDASCRQLLKQELLADWHAHFDDSEIVKGEALPEWIKLVDKVDLIECDLLVPKVKKT